MSLRPPRRGLAAWQRRNKTLRPARHRGGPWRHRFILWLCRTLSRRQARKGDSGSAAAVAQSRPPCADAGWERIHLTGLGCYISKKGMSKELKDAALRAQSASSRSAVLAFARAVDAGEVGVAEIDALAAALAVPDPWRNSHCFMKKKAEATGVAPPPAPGPRPGGNPLARRGVRAYSLGSVSDRSRAAELAAEGRGDEAGAGGDHLPSAPPTAEAPRDTRASVADFFEAFGDVTV
mmetsp:Transcript_50425/g.141094  ORF Transcript_50425/g.141094 Transcript_50425/m.141094 type:complete len:236 (-) Transcript_50425:30-737(-)